MLDVSRLVCRAVLVCGTETTRLLTSTMLHGSGRNLEALDSRYFSKQAVKDSNDEHSM